MIIGSVGTPVCSVIDGSKNISERSVGHILCHPENLNSHVA
jgi:hypothetical protein